MKMTRACLIGLHEVCAGEGVASILGLPCIVTCECLCHVGASADELLEQLGLQP